MPSQQLNEEKTYEFPVLKVENLRKSDDNKLLFVRFVGIATGVMADATKFAALEVGESASAVINVVKHKEKDRLNAFLVRFGDMSNERPKRGAGGKPFVPKSQAEVHGPNIARIVAAAIAAAANPNMVAKLANPGMKLYFHWLDQVEKGTREGMASTNGIDTSAPAAPNATEQILAMMKPDLVMVCDAYHLSTRAKSIVARWAPHSPDAMMLFQRMMASKLSVEEYVVDSIATSWAEFAEHVSGVLVSPRNGGA